MSFTYTPVPPDIPQEDAHRDQRWFRGSSKSRAVRPMADIAACEAQVFRWARGDTAEIRLLTTRGAAHFYAAVQLDPAALRDLAQRLLDAAHDIDAHPAKGAA